MTLDQLLCLSTAPVREQVSKSQTLTTVEQPQRTYTQYIYEGTLGLTQTGGSDCGVSDVCTTICFDVSDSDAYRSDCPLRLHGAFNNISI